MTPDRIDPAAPHPQRESGLRSSSYEFLIETDLLHSAAARARERGESVDDIIVYALRYFVDSDTTTAGSSQR